MKTAIATVSISGTLPEKLEAIAAAGFDGVEIFEQDFIAHDGGARDVGRMIRDHGLEIPLFQPFRDFECLPEPLRSKAFDRAKRKFDVMQELGTDLILICSSVHPRSLGGIKRAAGDLAELGEIARERGIRLGYEALAWGRHINDHRDAWEIVRQADHPNVGIILDSFHTLGRKLDPESIRAIPGEKIFFVQLADAPAIDMDLLYWSRHFRNMPGEGDLEVQRFMQAVMAAGYTGPISLEIFNDQFRGSNARATAQDGYRSLIALMDDVRRAEPETRIDLPAIPPRVRAEDVSFVEFAARDGEVETLTAMLRTLGFRNAAKHRNKAITLWQQGDVRIVVNSETEGHAAHVWNTRGLSVCDIGLQVSSAQDTVTRANALGSPTFSQPTGPGELAIPAIRGLGGSVLHFIDRTSGLDEVWDVEFDALPTEPHAGAGITHVDHLAQTMSYEDMLSWTLFYSTLFDMKKSPMVDVIDPDGLVRSQVVESAAGRLKITLNGAETHRTLAGRFLASTFGASVQHIALSTEDIFDTVARMGELGFEPLPIPGNYYDDLAARFDMPEGLLEKLRAGNILYDREGEAEFFQVYSRAFAGGMFFEIIQRGPGYKGFGGPNAPFRIAAQKRLGPPKGIPQS
ncbi:MULTISPECIES: bifunctional sugar phosphate isomerase/epimerase/4-hydroxyphenylpyruvate dioxygenase family protein [unclassified Salipiger]|uniref:bifunctional sugar phosphate isomerase/epimerase/4-hydroxyphenylpyruvate dioxygenase family protein n=1 Tax=unclassified Salipiger TaxID=2640570 RepID=UPI0013BD958D|nr:MULTISPECIES: sugar phosphate isomerase/epimerase and 4-hydroxyphenylpyruvate domain-containing protein [unclassified Salipiger]NDV48417.1 sugar phosphate isomerase/epimerase and 4-hydroxyphenylpyruvate domain-containing protein [Salipiger sp. PrR003]NDW35234.1 sugar phosphate isomerase/epimerase and 4-hydroxyphenylpyruvate domain-containing protein [Salipiger sp. PrR007]